MYPGERCGGLCSDPPPLSCPQSPVSCRESDASTVCPKCCALCPCTFGHLERSPSICMWSRLTMRVTLSRAHATSPAVLAGTGSVRGLEWQLPARHLLPEPKPGACRVRSAVFRRAAWLNRAVGTHRVSEALVLGFCVNYSGVCLNVTLGLRLWLCAPPV